MDGIFDTLKKEGLTTLQFRYDFRTDKMSLFAAKEWDGDFDFSRYNKDFYLGSVFTSEDRYLGTALVREMFKKHDSAEYLESVIDLIRQGKHFGMDCYYYDKHNIRFAGCLHSARMGINNMRAFQFGGGFRRHELDEPEYEVIKDGLNLSRAMSFKNVATKLPVGGSKTVVQMDPIDLNNLEIVGFLAYCINCLRTSTSTDMGFPVELNDIVVANGYTPLFNGGSRSRIGPGSVPTAYGTYLAMIEAVRFTGLGDSMSGLTVAVQGIGGVGSMICKYALEDGAKLIVADISQDRVKGFIESNPGKAITTAGADDILFAKADVLSPCSIGGILDEDTIRKLRCKVIIGSANNILSATNQEEEIRLSKLIEDRGILFQESWWHNGAGIWGGTYENDNGEKANLPEFLTQVKELIPVQTRKNLGEARQRGLTPTENMYRSVESTLYGPVN